MQYLETLERIYIIIQKYLFSMSTISGLSSTKLAQYLLNEKTKNIEWDFDKCIKLGISKSYEQVRTAIATTFLNSDRPLPYTFFSELIGT